jgi:hypothetical protein
MEPQTIFDPQTALFGIYHETVGRVAFTPEGDPSEGMPRSFVFNRVISKGQDSRLVPLESEGTSKINADLCGGNATGEVSGNRIRCKKCTPRFCVLRATMYSIIASTQEHAKNSEVTVA